MKILYSGSIDEVRKYLRTEFNEKLLGEDSPSRVGKFRLLDPGDFESVLSMVDDIERDVYKFGKKLPAQLNIIRITCVGGYTEGETVDDDVPTLTPSELSKTVVSQISGFGFNRKEKDSSYSKYSEYKREECVIIINE